MAGGAAQKDNQKIALQQIKGNSIHIVIARGNLADREAIILA
jgi:hypothetical protein